jgi:hypothetical protein
VTTNLVDMTTSIYGAVRSVCVGSTDLSAATRGAPLSVQTNHVAFGESDGGSLMVLARVRAVIRHLERDGRGAARQGDAGTAEMAVVSAPAEPATRPKRAGDAFWTALREIDLTHTSETDGRDHNAMSPRR